MQAIKWARTRQTAHERRVKNLWGIKFGSDHEKYGHRTKSQIHQINKL